MPPPRPRTLVPTAQVPKRPATPSVPPRPPSRGQSSRSTTTAVPQLRTTPQTSTSVPTVPVMAQVNNKLLRSPPKPFKGKADQALAFWNTLENYYNINAAIYTADNMKIAMALTHFKQEMQAEEWASDLMATALGQTPADYGTWAAFKMAFKKQFIPPETQVQAIAQMHACKMVNREFNEWFQEWSQHARRANVNDVTKMFAFCNNLNSALNQKMMLLTPQPTTLAAAVKKARDFNRNWQLYAGPGNSNRGPPHCGNSNA